ncbi:MAG TPA: hypothetical protein VE954_28930 [Oligoflexus sp.]|uniref:hypothetical protein n=1 Tax=Oligoflexus sp. TaxID=1971216 RepID=UPI002D45D9FB|nr:hypothetical protein [Oligoflexus sp.]HYX37146.1 hypothetical protein [Oligoflexus sp.]
MNFAAKWGRVETRCWNDIRPKHGEVSLSCSAAFIQNETYEVELKKENAADNCSVRYSPYIATPPLVFQPIFENFTDGRCDSAEKSTSSYGDPTLPLYSRMYLFPANKSIYQEIARRECEQAGNSWSDISSFSPVRDLKYCYQKYEGGLVVTMSFDPEHRQLLVYHNPTNIFY